MSAGAALQPVEICAVADTLRRRLADVLAVEGTETARLAAARTSVTFRLADEEDTVTVLLDRMPPAVADGNQAAEIEISLPATQAAEFARGRLRLPVALFMGELAYVGPVRKYLIVDAVLRSLLARATGEA